MGWVLLIVSCSHFVCTMQTILKICFKVYVHFRLLIWRFFFFSYAINMLAKKDFTFADQKCC